MQNIFFWFADRREFVLMMNKSIDVQYFGGIFTNYYLTIFIFNDFSLNKA